jgi:hypothetical protein
VANAKCATDAMGESTKVIFWPDEIVPLVTYTNPPFLVDPPGR